ncbi:augmenter of liver regeneration [Parasitella parasitica]|nr:augmenter of liver regeneration [Parasitella parasitica]
MAGETVYVDPTTGKQIPMKDGKPCRVCVDFKTWAKLEKGKKPAAASAAATNSKEQSASMETNSGTKSQEDPASSMKTDSETKFDDEWKRNNCPADVQTLGRHTWTLLHTMAAYYPEKPEKHQQESIKSFFESFSEHYPCWFCKNDFKKDMAENPIDLTNRETLSEWLCRRHNKVNEKLGKKQFDCSKVFERWLTGPANGKCDE